MCVSNYLHDGDTYRARLHHIIITMTIWTASSTVLVVSLSSPPTLKLAFKTSLHESYLFGCDNAIFLSMNSFLITDFPDYCNAFQYSKHVMAVIDEVSRGSPNTTETNYCKVLQS